MSHNVPRDIQKTAAMETSQVVTLSYKGAIPEIFTLYHIFQTARVSWWLTGGITSKDNKVVTLWEETYIKNMKYAAQRLQEVMIVNTGCQLIKNQCFCTLTVPAMGASSC